MKVKPHGGGRGRAGDTHAAGGSGRGHGSGGSPAGREDAPCPGRVLAGRVAASPTPLRGFCPGAAPAAALLWRGRRRAGPDPGSWPGPGPHGTPHLILLLLLLPLKHPCSSSTSAIPNIGFESSDGKLFQLKLALLMAAHTSVGSGSCTLSFPYVAALCCGCALLCSGGLQS